MTFLIKPLGIYIVLKGLKARSARGSDGISAAELRQLPAAAIDDLADVLLSYHNGFPAWLMIARTTPVPKQTGANGPGDFRPITTLAQTYRLWSQVISRTILQAFSRVMPDTITGFLPGRGPLMLPIASNFSLRGLTPRAMFSPESVLTSKNALIPSLDLLLPQH